MPSKWREELESTNPLDALRRTGGGPKQVEPVRTMADEQPQTIAIDQIMPDPAQARRAMPDDLRTAWLSGQTPITDLFQRWEHLALEQHQGVLGWEKIINPPDDQRPADEAEFTDGPNMAHAPIAAQWMKLVNLAAGVSSTDLARDLDLTLKKLLSGRVDLMAVSESYIHRLQADGVPLEKVANVEKKVPKRFLTPDGFNVTAACRRYLEPLIQGEDYPPYKNGLPHYVTLKNELAPKKLKTPWEPTR